MSLDQPLLSEGHLDEVVAVDPGKPQSVEQRLLAQREAEYHRGIEAQHSSRPSVNIAFRRLSYVVQGNKRILHNLNGEFRHGELAALMGPSGAGKSTLLNVLAGFRTKESEGRVLVNGEDRFLPTFRKMSCFVMQEDILLKNLTVTEYMMMSAELRLSPQIPKHVKTKMVLDAMRAIGLHERAETKSGSLSGGQKKRLAVALELLNDPPLLFLDEPTSGLDSTTALAVTQMLKQLAANGRTIICTIHQPSATLFELFDQVYLLSQGQCLYQGTVGDIVPYFKGKGIPCPQYHNPADFILEVATGEKGSVQPLLAEWRDKESSEVPTIQSLVRPDVKRATYVTTLGEQFSVLLRRSFKEITRDKILTRIRAAAHVNMGILLGVLYLNMGVKADKVSSLFGYFFFSILFLMLTAIMPTVLTFPVEKEVFTREHLNNWYSVRSYYFAKSVADFPFQVIFPVIYTVITYWMIDLPHDGARFFKFLLVLVLHTQVAQSLGVVISAAAPSLQVAVFLAPMTSIPMILFSGFFVKLADITPVLRWISWVSYFRYSFEGLVKAVCEDLDNGVGNAMIHGLGFQGQGAQSYEFQVFMLLLFFVILKIAAYMVLRRKAKKTY